MPPSKIVAVLRDAEWLNQARASAYVWIFLGAQVLALLGLLAFSSRGMDMKGDPLGTDFLSFWSAGRLALMGSPQSVYDVAAHHAAQKAEFGPDAPYYAFFYPPIYLMLCLPLGLAPYFVSLAVWLAATGWAYVRALRAFAAEAAPYVALLAFPAVFIAIGHGQNAFLTTALFAAGVTALGGRPVLAGLCFGALAFKPHLALVVPVGLVALGQWRAIASAAITALALAAASLALFGEATWRAYFEAAGVAKLALDQNLIGPEKMQSAYAAARVLGFGAGVGYALQALVALCACVALARFVRRVDDVAARGAMMAGTALLASPFLLDYDLLFLAMPLAYLFRAGRREGFAPWEKSTLLAGWVLPSVSRALATQFHAPMGPVVIALVCLAVWRRGTALPARPAGQVAATG